MTQKTRTWPACVGESLAVVPVAQGKMGFIAYASCEAGKLDDDIIPLEPGTTEVIIWLDRANCEKLGLPIKETHDAVVAIDFGKPEQDRIGFIFADNPGRHVPPSEIACTTQVLVVMGPVESECRPGGTVSKFAA